MTRSPRLVFVAIALLASFACGGVEDPELRRSAATCASCDADDEKVDKQTSFSDIWHVGTSVIDGVKALYSGINWFNCTFGDTCAETDIHREATRILNTMEAEIGRIYSDDKIADVDNLFERASTDYRHPDLMTQIEEQDLVNEARDVFIHFRDRLKDVNATDQADVEIAYVLAPFFEFLAALVDNIDHQALRGGRVPMDLQEINQHRQDTLDVNHALVGAQSLWYSCPGAAGPTQISTVESVANVFATKKLWRKFASYDVGRKMCSDDYVCNPFNAAKSPPENVCRRTHCQAGLFCHACDVGDGHFVYQQELPKILDKMNRDSVVRTVRASIEELVKRPAEHGAGLLVQRASGDLDLWKMWSRNSYRSVRIGTPGPGWEVAGTGDFTGGGRADILFMNRQGLSAKLWRMSEGRLLSETASGPAPAGTSTPYIGDLDGDGISDILWTGVLTIQPSAPVPVPPVRIFTTATWMMNAGSITPRSQSVTGSQTEQVQALGDFDGDAQHRADILYRAPSGTVTIAISGGGRNVLGAVTADWTIKGVGDFNRDGTSDVLWYNTVSGQVSIWVMRAGVIDYTTVPATVAPSSGWSVRTVTDVDHDGISDIIWRHSTGPIGIWIMEGPASVRTFLPQSALNTADVLAGALDLGPPVPENVLSPTVSEASCGVSTGTLRNPGFADYETWAVETVDNGNGTFLADVTGDNRADLVTIGSAGVNVLRSTGSGFGAKESWSAFNLALCKMALGDIDGDGRHDLVRVCGHDTWSVMWPRGDRWGENGPSKFIDGPFGPWPTDQPETVLIADVDGDGRGELLTFKDPFFTVYRWDGLRFSSVMEGRSRPSERPLGVFVADVTGDGRADLVEIGTDYVIVSRSFADPTTTGGLNFTGGEIWRAHFTLPLQLPLIGDVDGDGKADLVFQDASAVRVFRSTGDAFADPETWWGNAFYANHANLLGDLDGNKRADLTALGDGFVGVIRSQ
jgi:hypothetical protein